MIIHNFLLNYKIYIIFLCINFIYAFITYQIFKIILKNTSFNYIIIIILSYKIKINLSNQAQQKIKTNYIPQNIKKNNKKIKIYFIDFLKMKNKLQKIVMII